MPKRHFTTHEATNASAAVRPCRLNTLCRSPSQLFVRGKEGVARGGREGKKNKGLLEGKERAMQGREEDMMARERGAWRPWRYVKTGVPARVNSMKGRRLHPQGLPSRQAVSTLWELTARVRKSLLVTFC